MNRQILALLGSGVKSHFWPMSLQTPKSCWPVVVTIAIAWVYAPWIVIDVTKIDAETARSGFETQFLAPGVYALVFMVYGIPYFALLLFFALRRYKPGVPLLTFAVDARHLLGLILILPGLAYSGLAMAYWWSWSYAFAVADYAIVFLWLLWVRPMISVKNGN